MTEGKGGLSEAQKKALEDRGFKDKGGVPIIWEAGMEVEGVFVELRPKASANQSPVLVMDLGKDGRRKYWAHTILARRVSEDYSPGDTLHIICMGRIDVKGRSEKAWDFEVWGK